jgi:hypothetical protein
MNKEEIYVIPTGNVIGFYLSRETVKRDICFFVNLDICIVLDGLKSIPTK